MDRLEDSVDVVVLTKNSQRCLKECIDSIYKNAPVHQLIVVDGYSTDETLSILKSFDDRFHNVKVVFDKGTRATARKKGIDLVTTDWFIFTDSDVSLCKDWYEKAKDCINNDVGGVWGTEIWSTIQTTSILKIFLIVTRKIFEVRGGTHDTLIRTDLVKDIKIPATLHVFEDAYIKEWVERKGFSMVACYVPFCIHYRPKNVWTFRGSLALISEALKFGHPRLLLKLLAAYGFYTVYSVYQLVIAEKR